MTDITQAFAEAFVEAAIPKFRQIVKEELQASKAEDLQKKYISIDGFMNMFDPAVSRGTIYNWEKSGLFKSCLIGGRRVIKYTDAVEAVERIKKYSRNNDLSTTK